MCDTCGAVSMLPNINSWNGLPALDFRSQSDLVPCDDRSSGTCHVALFAHRLSISNNVKRSKLYSIIFHPNYKEFFRPTFLLSLNL
jgi:hypothetical protein